jgi:signal transduction histidine kinase/DNA-binding NarL/FixJ family response regulator
MAELVGESSSVKQLQERLNRNSTASELAYTTVATMLKRLEQKGLVVREGSGSRLCYRSLVGTQELQLILLEPLALETARPNQTLLRTQAALHSILLKVISSHDLPSILEQVLNSIDLAFEVSRAAIFLERGGRLLSVAQRGLSQAYFEALNDLNYTNPPIRQRAVETGRVVYAEDVSNPTSPFYRPHFVAEGIRTVLFAPFRYEGHLTGGISLYPAQIVHYSPQEIEAVQLFADQTAVAIVNAQLLESSNRRANRLAALQKITRAVASSSTLEDIFEIMHAEASMVLPFDYLELVWFDAFKQVYYRRQLYPQLWASFKEMVPPEELGYYQTLQTREPIIRNLTSADEKDTFTPFKRQQVEKLMLGSWLSVPIYSGKAHKVNGALQLGKAQTNFYSLEHYPLAGQLADQLALALDREQITAELREAVRVEVVTEERNRVAREIHDTLAQSLAGIVVQLRNLQEQWPAEVSGPLRQNLEAAQELARQALEEARRSIWQLKPGPLEDKTLVEALVNEIEQRCAQVGLSSHLRVSGTPRPLHPELEAALFRTVQEALTNTIKYARASRVTTELNFEEKAVTLTISDNGQGFDPQHYTTPQGGGFGLVGMRERLRLVGGQLSLSSAKGQGTTITASVNLEIPVMNELARLEVEQTLTGKEPVETTTNVVTTATPSKIRPVRVLLADDHFLARQGLKQVLERDRSIEIIGEASSGEEALRLVQELKPEVLLTDLMMPGLNGIEITHQLKQHQLSSRVIILTTYDSDDSVLAAIRAGVSAFLLKDVSPNELIATIHSVAAGVSILQHSRTARLFGRLNEGEVGAGLSEREFEILSLLASGRRDKEIALTLSISQETVRSHLRRIYQKLEVQSRTEAVGIALRRAMLKDHPLPPASLNNATD